jgi:hypothetical protein
MHIAVNGPERLWKFAPSVALLWSFGTRTQHSPANGFILNPNEIIGSYSADARLSQNKKTPPIT